MTASLTKFYRFLAGVSALYPVSIGNRFFGIHVCKIQSDGRGPRIVNSLAAPLNPKNPKALFVTKVGTMSGIGPRQNLIDVLLIICLEISTSGQLWIEGLGLRVQGLGFRVRSRVELEHLEVLRVVIAQLKAIGILIA